MSSIPTETPVSHLVWRERRTLFAVAAVALAAGVGYTLFAPPVWEAKATIVFPVKSPSILGSGGIGEASMGLAALAGGPTPLKVFGGFLESQRTLGFVAKRTNMTPREVREMRLVLDQAMESSLTISARSRDADLAKRVVALHLQALDRINVDLSQPLVGDDVRTITEQLVAGKRKLRDAEQRLLAFQRQAKTAPAVAASGMGEEAAVVPGASRWADMARSLEIEKGRVDAAIASVRAHLRSVAAAQGELPVDMPAVAKWRDKLAEAEYNLRVSLLTLSPESAEAEKLRQAVALSKARLRKEVDAYARSAGLGVAGTAEKPNGDAGLSALLLQQAGVDAQLLAVRRLASLAPTEAIELTRLTREVATASAVVTQLEGMRTMAVLQKERDPNRWEVLDPPQIDDKPVNKSFSKNLTIAALVGLLFGSLGALYRGSRRPRLTLEDGDEAEVPRAA